MQRKTEKERERERPGERKKERVVPKGIRTAHVVRQSCIERILFWAKAS